MRTLAAGESLGDHMLTDHALRGSATLGWCHQQPRDGVERRDGRYQLLGQLLSESTKCVGDLLDALTSCLAGRQYRQQHVMFRVAGHRFGV